MSTISKNKEELLAAIKDTFAKLDKDLEGISLEMARNSEMDGHAKGTMMSVCDLLAYLIGWGELVLSWNRQTQNGEVINFPTPDFKWTELGLLAQQFYKDYQHLDFSELRIRLKETVERLLILVASMTDESLYGTPFYKHYPFGRMVQLNSSAPYKNARTRLRKWKKLN